jgi:class 3 adenylate cyclase
MVDDPRAGAGTAAYRGFLFSDMRGFTAYAERHGNAAAAAAVSRFLDIARKAIARHNGSEMTTEGDAIHAVFPSASSAVLCGLEIQDAAAAMNAAEPGHPIQLGVGVHAGEAVETAEGYIGRAVNIAARLCAAAKPGEVLVSSTVKGITQSSIAVGFIPRGQKRLKGIADPIQVYAVTRDVNARAPRAVPRPVAVGGAALGAVAVLVIAMLAGSQLRAPTATPPPSEAPVIKPVSIGSLSISTYRSLQFQPEVRFDITEDGWVANRDAADYLGLVWSAEPRGNVDFLRIQQVLTSPCGQGEEVQPSPPSAADILSTLQGLNGYLTVSEPETVRIGGFTGRQVDVTVAESALAACGGLAGGDVTLFVVGGETWQASGGERFRLVALTVGQAAVTIVVSSDWPQIRSVQELESLLDRGEGVIDTASFR